jgi:hypothetical protein
MLECAIERATIASHSIVSDALKMVARQIGGEIERLEDLHQINSNVSLEEIEGVRARQSALVAAIGAARVRVGALRLIVGRG